jgi:hypothetical protein
VATLATASDIHVNRAQECSRGKTTGSSNIVTDTAIIPRWDVIHFLTRGDITIMAGGAVVRDTRVTERRGNKSICAEMADRAILGRR